jgi:Tfp pilus assembly protein PilO
MTDTRKWTVGAVLVSVLILIAGWFLLIAPQRAEVTKLQTETQTQDNNNSAAETELAVLKQQNKDLPEKQAELAALETKIPDSADLPTYIREMQDIGRKAGVDFTSLAPTTPVTMGGGTGTGGALVPEQLAALNVDMIVTGDYFQITKFMNDLETAERYTLVSGYDITTEGSDGTTASDSTDGSTSDSTVLTATINARIFLVPPTPEVDLTATTSTTATGTTSTAPSPAPAP